MPEFRQNQTWTSLVPEQYRGLARRDEASYEGDGVHTTFPHDFDGAGGADGEIASGDNRAYNRWFSDSPFADEALFALAKEAVQALLLGQRNATDFLALAIKSVDRIGHDYGPNSQEQLDILYRLDQQLGLFFDYLDEAVGRDNYVIAVSADHGSINVVEYENEQGRPGRRVSEKEIQRVLDNIDRFVKTYDGPGDALPDRIARELERVDFIARAMTPEELSGTGPADEILRAYRNSYIPGRNTTFPLWTNEVLYGKFSETHPANWGIIVEFAENTSLWTARANHGTSHWYDREVPIIFVGKAIKPGIATEPARTVDIAPTLADLAGVPFPNAVDGRVLRIP
jgi:predicted AlkP superfamily pyrophosphatase or phosphodiesterase